MPKKKDETLGEVSFQVEETIAGVFGDYSSLKMLIGLRFPGNVENFEEEIDRFLPRALVKMQGTMNQIAVESGFPEVWPKEG